MKMLLIIILGMVTVLSLGLVMFMQFGGNDFKLNGFMERGYGREMVKQVQQSQQSVFTKTTDKVCQGNQCTLTLYSGTRNVFEDKEWKRVEDAKSLKGSGINCIVDYDGEHYVECLDWNLTSKKLKFKITKDSQKNKDIPIKVYDFEDKLKKEKKIKLNDFNDEHIEWIDSSYGDEVHFGESSTIVILQDNETEVTEDVSLWPSAYYDTGYLDLLPGSRASAIKFNLESIDAAVIISGNLSLKSVAVSPEQQSNVSVFSAINQSWTETSIPNRGAGRATLQINDSINDKVTVFNDLTNYDAYDFNVTEGLKWVYGLGYKNYTVFINNSQVTAGGGIHAFRQKEAVAASNRPKLTVTYTEDPCIYTSGNWVITQYCNFTGTDLIVEGNLTIESGGTLNLTNSTITFNMSNQYIIFDNVADEDKLILNEFSQIN